MGASVPDKTGHFVSVPEAKFVQDQIEGWSCRAPIGRQTVNEVIAPSVGAQDWSSCDPAGGHELLARPSWRFETSCPERTDDGMCAIGVSLFLCHVRGLSHQLDSSLGKLAAGLLPRFRFFVLVLF